LVRTWNPTSQAEFHVMGSAHLLMAAVRVPVVHDPGYAAAIERRGGARARLLGTRARCPAWHRYEQAILGSADASWPHRTRRPYACRRIATTGGDPSGSASRTSLDPLGCPPLSILFVGNFTHPRNRDAAWCLTPAIHLRLQRGFPVCV
jgi:hypothetical protein